MMIWWLFPKKEQRIAYLQYRIEALRWKVLFDLRKHDRIVPKIRKLENALHKLGGKRLDA